MAIIDWFSRFVQAWELSITLDTSFCLEALDRALQTESPAPTAIDGKDLWLALQQPVFANASERGV